jgi:acyl-CoA thioesterase YciA
MTIRLEVWVNSVLHDRVHPLDRFKVTAATFTYVAVDNEGRKRPVRN